MTDNLTGWQMFTLLGLGWLIVALLVGLIAGRLMAINDEDDEEN